MGGGFGAKFGAGDYGVLAAKLSKKAGKPVLHDARPQEEHLSAATGPTRGALKLGGKKDGTLTASDYESTARPASPPARAPAGS